MKVKSVADKVNELLNLQLNSDDDSDSEINESTAPRVVDFEQDEYEIPDGRSTEFRKRNVKLLSEESSRYKGKISSRKELQDDINSEEDDSNSDDNGAGLQKSSEEESMEEDGEGDEINEEEESDDDDYDLDSESGDEKSDQPDDEATGVISESNRQAEIQKGVSVQNQLRIWERLLEFRIHTQKILTKANQLPAHVESNRSDYKSDIAIETAEKTCHLLKSLLELKTTLTSQFSELQSDLKSSIKETSLLQDYENGAPPLKRIAVCLADQHNQMRSYRNKVLLKWDDRTKLLKPGGGKRKMTEEFDVIRKIDNALLNKDALISKSRILQNVDASAEQTEETANDSMEEIVDTGDANVYDDSDFYHQQLRELIEYKASNTSNLSEITKQMVELQKIRQKMKRKVDTRASKGRKIRYVIHNKLINFMAPDDSDSVNWNNESKDELYKSLFAT